MNDRFIIQQSNDDYIVYWLEWDSETQSYEKPRPMKNFGNWQSDALEYKNYDCPQFTERQLKLAVNNYDKNKRYQRNGFRNYKLQKACNTK